jgi:hypothetical protein
MILNGSQRGGARDLAIHLMKAENEHVEVHEIRGFVAATLAGALQEAEAVSRGTQCRKFLYSLSLSPPETENVPVAIFENAIDRIEEKLGLAGHARVVVFHEKQGRRHAHCIWSRIDVQTMTAVRMSHDRHKLTDLSRELYFEHGWKMPQGLIDPELRNPLNFDRHEWFKAKRTGKDPRDIKAAFQQCWAASDSGKAFRHALEQRGYYLARGDRRAVVAIDLDGEVYAVGRWTGLHSKQIVARVSDIGLLPGVTEVQERVAALVQEKLTNLAATAREEFARAANKLEARRLAMVQRHRLARAELEQKQVDRRTVEAKERGKRFRKGLLGLWDRVTGRYAILRMQNEQEAETARKRDLVEKDVLVRNQLVERQELQGELQLARRQETEQLARLLRRSLYQEQNYDRSDDRDSLDNRRDVEKSRPDRRHWRVKP